jgi:hypothetical protein
VAVRLLRQGERNITKENIMELINDQELKRRLMQNPKSLFASFVKGYQAGMPDAGAGEHIDLDKFSLSDCPSTIFNGYCIENERGTIVGVDCHMLYNDKGDTLPFKADLAIATNVPGFWTIHEGVLVTVLEPIPGTKGDGRIHLADAMYSHEIAAISMMVGPAPTQK